MELLSLAKITSLAIVLFLFLPAEMGAASECKTTGGEKCVFPFKFEGKEYTECTWDWAFHGDRNDRALGRAWCGTREEAEWGRGWGDCGEGCPIPGEETISISIKFKYSSSFSYLFTRKAKNLQHN